MSGIMCPRQMVFAKWTRVVTITALHKMWKGDIVKQASLNDNMMIVARCICVQDKWYLQSEPPPNGNSHIPESFTQSILLPPTLMEWVWDKGKDIFWSKPLDCLFMPSIYIFFSSHLTIESISVRRNSPFLPRAHGHFIKSLLFLHYITLTHPPHWSKEPNFSHQKNISHFLRPFIYTASQFWLWSFWATFSNCFSETLRILGEQSISH